MLASLVVVFQILCLDRCADGVSRLVHFSLRHEAGSMESDKELPNGSSNCITCSAELFCRDAVRTVRCLRTKLAGAPADRTISRGLRVVLAHP